MSDLPVIYDITGPVAKTAEELRQQVIETATRLSPGITTDLPGSLIEDMTSTSVGALLVCDQASVDLINSCSPYGANVHLLKQLGAIYGVQQGKGRTPRCMSYSRGRPALVFKGVYRWGWHLFVYRETGHGDPRQRANRAGVLSGHHYGNMGGAGRHG